MTKCYEFIDVTVNREDIQARPVAWDREIYDGAGNDKAGNPAEPVEFHATCPYCGNLIHFSKDDMLLDKNKKHHVKCAECGAGKEALPPTESNNDYSFSNKEIQPEKSVFLDPIADGLFDLEVDHELLKKVESAESN